MLSGRIAPSHNFTTAPVFEHSSVFSCLPKPRRGSATVWKCLSFIMLISFGSSLSDAADIDTSPLPQPFGTYNLPNLETPQHEALVTGKLIFEDQCLYLASEDRKLVPLFPDQFTTWSPSDKVLTILGHAIPMGAQIETNGGYIRLEDVSQFNLVGEIPAHCASPEIAIVGTQAWGSSK